MKHFITYLLLICSVLNSCTLTNDDLLLEEALEMAGDNRSELERVLEHYANDEERLEAAKFLIRNMPGHYSYADTTAVVTYSKDVDSILEAMKGCEAEEIRDSVDACAERHRIANLATVADINTIKADYLIKNIDTSFRLWREKAWAEHLNFDDFCEYLLPYKVEELQLLDDWKERLSTFLAEDVNELKYYDIYKGAALAAARAYNFTLRDSLKANNDFPFRHHIMKLETFSKVPCGTCHHYSVFTTATMRSQGIPVAIDYTPQWAFRDAGHSWNVVLGSFGKAIPFSGADTEPGKGHKVDEKMAKVYRHTYAQNHELLELNNADMFVPGTFRNIFQKDVTEEYMAHADVTVGIKAASQKYAYLAVFDNKVWQPVAYAEIKHGKASFAKMGRNIVYLPIGFDENGKMEVYGDPFLLRYDGSKKVFKADKEKNVQLKIERKYPVLTNYPGQCRLLTCEFQASNDPAFSSYYLVHKISDAYGKGYDIIVPDTIPPCRYWRFVSKRKDTHCNVAELFFFDDKDSLRRDGRIIGTAGTYPTSPDCTKDMVFDGDILTFYDAPDGDESWVGMDFGKPITVSHLYYYGRGDGNAIEPDDLYELFYWSDGAWQSLGKQTPGKPLLQYDAPSGALYWIRDLTKGKQERIFEYDNNEQIWW